MKKRLCSLGVFLLCVGVAGGQGRAVIALETNFPDAVVYIDSVRQGPAHWEIFGAAVGRRTVRLVAPSLSAWSVTPATQEVLLEEGDTARVVLPFPIYHHLESLPLGASVYLQTEQKRALLGQTPITYSAAHAPDGRFVIEHPGYQRHQVTPRDDIWNRYTITLQPLHGEVTAGAVVSVDTHRRRRWIDVAATGIAVAGGILAVHYKFKADRLDDDYRATGDPALRPRIARLDDRAAIALVGMQAGLITLGVRFYLKR